MTLKVYSPDADLVNNQLREFFKDADVTSILVNKWFSVHKVNREKGSGIGPSELFMFGIEHNYSMEIL